MYESCILTVGSFAPPQSGHKGTRVLPFKAVDRQVQYTVTEAIKYYNLHVYM